MTQETTYGDATLGLIEQALDDGARQVALLMRHSARTFNRDIHDLENPLTDEGRALCTRLGQRLPGGLTVRGYASPAQRCQETAQLVMDAYAEGGGATTRVRPVEAFGPFYALDQQRMWKGLTAADGMHNYVQQWLDAQLPTGVLLPAPLAASAIVQQMAARFDAAGQAPGSAQTGAAQTLTLCVSHDLSLMMVRGQILQQAPALAPVEFLDALVLYQRDDELFFASHLGPPKKVSAELRLD